MLFCLRASNLVKMTEEKKLWIKLILIKFNYFHFAVAVFIFDSNFLILNWAEGEQGGLENEHIFDRKRCGDLLTKQRGPIKSIYVSWDSDTMIIAQLCGFINQFGIVFGVCVLDWSIWRIFELMYFCVCVCVCVKESTKNKNTNCLKRFERPF